MRLVSRRVPRQSHWLGFARVRAWVFRKKKKSRTKGSDRGDEENEKTPRLLLSSVVRGRLWRKNGLDLLSSWRRPERRMQRVRAQSCTLQSEQTVLGLVPRKRERGGEEETDCRESNRPPKLHERYDVLCVWCTVQCVGANLVIIYIYICTRICICTLLRRIRHSLQTSRRIISPAGIAAGKIR